MNITKNLILGAFFCSLLGGCVSSGIPDTGASDELAASRYVYSYCLFQAGIIYGSRDAGEITETARAQSISACDESRTEYQEQIKSATFEGRQDFTEADLERFRELTAQRTLQEIDMIIFSAVDVELERLREAQNGA